jgi:hypothetical protein
VEKTRALQPRARSGDSVVGLVTWAGANIVPLVLIPLAAVLIWVAIWKVWLPRPGGGTAVARAVTTVDANAGTRPTHKVTTVVKTAGQTAPSRRSEMLVIVLLFLGAGATVIGVFHERIASLEVDKDGVKITLNRAEKDGAAELVDRLARSGAGPRAYANGLHRYLRAVATRRPAAGGRVLATSDAAPAADPPGLGAAEAKLLAHRIADDLA